VQAASALVMCSLQKALLSSVEAFACTLKVHRDAFEAHVKKVAEGTPAGSSEVGRISRS